MFFSVKDLPAFHLFARCHSCDRVFSITAPSCTWNRLDAPLVYYSAGVSAFCILKARDNCQKEVELSTLEEKLSRRRVTKAPPLSGSTELETWLSPFSQVTI